MLLYIPNENHRNLIFLDTEFNDRNLIQVSMIIYESYMVHDVSCYLLKGSLNLYINNEINTFFTRYTGITQDFLDKHGIPQDQAAEVIQEFIKDCTLADSMFIAHGIKQDMTLIQSIGVNFGSAERYCTYNNAKRLLNRDKNLRLIDVCNESGYFAEQHDAYSDAKNVVHAFSYLKLVEAIAR